MTTAAVPSLAPLPTAVAEELNAPFKTSAGFHEEFQRRGFAVLRGVLSKETIDYYRHVIVERVFQFTKETRPLNERDDYNRAFLQITDLWKKCDLVRALVTSRRLGSVAAAAVGAPAVRVLNDHALYKEPGGGPTFRHSDWHYIPIKEDQVCAVWLPLQDTPINMGALQFIEGSHRFAEMQSHGVFADSDAKIRALAEAHGLQNVATDFRAGDISIHNVRTAHWTLGNTTPHPRSVISNFYVGDGCHYTSEPVGDFQKQYWKDIIGGEANAGQCITGEAHPRV